MSEVVLGRVLGWVDVCVGQATVPDAQKAGRHFCLASRLPLLHVLCRQAIPDWLIWTYWINPLSWAARSMVANEMDTEVGRWVGGSVIRAASGDELCGLHGRKCDGHRAGWLVGWVGGRVCDQVRWLLAGAELCIGVRRR